MQSDKADGDGQDTGGGPWYGHERFAKFWYNYNTMMMKAHQDAIVRAKYSAVQKKAVLARMLVHMRGGHAADSKIREMKYSSGSSRTASGSTRSNRNKKKRKRKKRNRRLRELARLNNQDGVSDTELLHSQMSKGMHINDTEDEEEDMELNEDMLTFLELSHKHRTAWKVRKTNIMAGNSGMLITPSLDDGVLKEHPDVIRSREMQQLYGSASPRIHAMETAIQLSFDRISTLHRPQFWPNIPLRVMF